MLYIIDLYINAGAEGILFSILPGIPGVFDRALKISRKQEKEVSQL